MQRCIWLRLQISGLLLVCVFSIFDLLATSNIPMQFRRYSLDEGLSQGTIRSLLQDKKGYIWIATQDGLNRFDGYQFTIFRHEEDNTNSLSSDYVLHMLESSDGTLWFATQKGLNRFDRYSETFRHYQLGEETREGFGSQTIYHLMESHDGHIWAATLGGLYLFDPKTGESTAFVHDKNVDSSLVHNAVYAVLQDHQGRIWVGTFDGLDTYSRQNREFIHWFNEKKPGLTGNNISALAQDHDGYIWIGTYNSGLNRLDPATGQVVQYRNKVDDRHSLAHDRVRSLLVDKFNKVWVGTQQGLSLYNRSEDRFDNQLHDESVKTSLSEDHVWSIMEDNNDSIWLGTGDGINQFVQSTRMFGHQRKYVIEGEGINHKRVRAIFKTESNQLWVGTDGGLNFYDPTKERYFYFVHDPNDPSSINRSSIMSVFVDSKQRVWAGSYDGGLNLMLPDGSFKRYVHQADNPQSLSDDRVYSISQDKQGTIWVGTNNGLNRYIEQTDSFEYFRHQPDDPNSLSYSGIYSVWHMDNGDMWIATRNGGVTFFSPKRNLFKRFTHQADDLRSLSHDRVFALYMENENELWAATSNGLNLLNISSGRFIRYGKRHGLLNSTIYAVTGDEQGYIWVSTNRGLARLDRTTQRFKHYAQIRGLQSSEFNNGAYFKAYDGELFFGGINGFNRFYPEQIKDNLTSPVVVLTDFLLANQFPGLQSDNPHSPLSQVINETDYLELTYQDPVFSFEFSALHFIDPAKNKFSYMLEGFDKKWIHTDAKHRRATYTNLSPGRYVFKVKAANSDGVWSEKVEQVTVRIHPAPWATWWAYLIYMSMLGSIIFAFAYQRMQKQRAVEESENRLSLALWGSGNEFWDWDMRNRMIVRSNHSFDFTLPSGREFSFDSLQSLVHPDDFAAMQAAFDRHERGEIEYYEQAYRIRGVNNDWVWVLDRGQIVSRDEKHRPERAIGTVQNINDLKLIESQLRDLNEELEDRVNMRTEELGNTVQQLADTIKKLTFTQEQLVEAEKAAALSNLVAGVAHEINTPVGICITGLSTLGEACDELFERQDEQRLSKGDFLRFKHICQQSIPLISGNLSRTAELVQLFKTVAAKDAAEQYSLCQLGPLVHATVSTFDSQLTLNKVDVEVIGDLEASVVSCGNSLDLVFRHLIDNSLIHGFGEQEVNGVALLPRKIKIEIEDLVEEVLIRFQDNGVGLKKLGKEQLFEPFYTTTRSKGQIGLGMHIVFNHVTQKLKGNIEVDESAIRGLGYKITLPVKIH